MLTNGTNPSKGAAQPPIADTSALEATVQRLQAQFNAFQSTDELASRLKTLELHVAAINPHDKEVVQAINALRKSVSTIERTVGAHLAPSKSLPGFAVESERVINAVAAAVADSAKKDEAVFNRELKDIRSDFQSLAAALDGSVKQLEVLANNHVELAASRLLKASRFFASSPVGTSSGIAKGNGLVENTILKGVSQ